jgi:hypothetical protein
MTSLATALSVALALALGAGKDARPRATEVDASWRATNSARAKAGLLPRKPPRKIRAVLRGRRLLPAAVVSPTFLGEPGTLADAAQAAPHREPQPMRFAAHGVVTDVTLSMRFDP